MRVSQASYLSERLRQHGCLGLVDDISVTGLTLIRAHISKAHTVLVQTSVQTQTRMQSTCLPLPFQPTLTQE